MKKNHYFSLMAVVCILFGGVHIVAAEEIKYENVPLFGAEGDFIVGPGKVEYTIEPGTDRTAELIITNRLGNKATFELSVEDVAGSSDPNTSVVLLGDQRGPYSVRDYIQLPVDRVELAHGERARISVGVNVPADAEPGGYYGSVLVSSITSSLDDFPSDDVAAPRSVVVSRVGTLYFITVPGDVRTEGALVEFSTIPRQSLFVDGPVPFEVLFENTGSVHLSPYGDITIQNFRGEEVGLVSFDPWYSLPGSLRYFETTFDRTWMFGRYTAEVELHRGYDEKVDTASVVFWVIPKIIIYATTAFAMLVGALIFWNRRKKVIAG